MATAAAPSAGEAAQPQPAPEGSEQGQEQAQAQGDGGSANPIESTEATGQDGLELAQTLTKGKLKPVRLPGVLEDGPELATERQETQEARQRDERGRFLPQSKPAVEGEPGAPTEPQTEAVPEPPADPNAPAKFEFAGEEFESQEKAEQNFKSLRGQFKPLIEDRNKAAESATGWYNAAQGLEAQNKELRAELERLSQAPPQSQPASEQTAQEATPESIDWELYAEIEKRAAEQGEPWKARKWLQDQIDAINAKKEAALVEKLTEPQRREEARRQLHQSVNTLFGSLAEYVNDSDGQPSFPELRDEKSAYMIGRLWQEMGLPKEYATSPQGAIAAIALYRMISGGQAAPPAAAPTPQADPTPPAPDLAAQAAAELGEGQPQPLPSANGTNADPRTVALLSGLRKTTLTRKGLGFSE